MFSSSPSAMSREIHIAHSKAMMILWQKEHRIREAFFAKIVKNMLADPEGFKNIIIEAVDYYLKEIRDNFFRGRYKEQALELKKFVLESNPISNIIDLLKSKQYSPTLNFILHKNAVLKYSDKKIPKCIARESYESIFDTMINHAKDYLEKPVELTTFVESAVAFSSSPKGA